MKKLNNKGFTLVELIIVIAILAIIMMIAIPNYSKIRRTSQVRADKVTAGNIGHAVRVWITEEMADGKYVYGEESSAIPNVIDNDRAKNYEELDSEITTYIAAGFQPQSLTNAGAIVKPEDAMYSVIMDSNEADAKVMVVIETKGDEVKWTPGATSIANYDGTGAGVAWVEGAPATGDASGASVGTPSVSGT